MLPARPGLAELTRRWHGKLRAEAPGTSIDAMWQAVDSHRDRTIELGQTASRAAGIRLAGQLADHQTVLLQCLFDRFGSVFP